jgi:hypothetical protein
MRRLLRRGARVPAATDTPLIRALAATGALVLVVAGTSAMVYPPAPMRPLAAPAATRQAPYPQIILPDLLVIAPKGLSAAQLARISKLSGVRHVITADGAAIKVGSHQVNLLGVNPRQFRSWTPLATASDQSLWTALADGRFVASRDAARRLGLHPGTRYGLTGAARQNLVFGGSAPLGVSGIDALISNHASAALGLVPSVVALVSAPGAGLTALTRGVSAAAGSGDTVVSLRKIGRAHV